MKNALFFALTLAAAPLFSQNGKGASPISSNPTGSTSSTVRAVVVGIRDYRDPGIPDLQFADRDATAFADWLKSEAGGNVPGDNIQLLLNEQATNAQIGLALYWLVDSSRAGDAAVIYFSGHGDLDSKRLRDQWGYLLTHDTPARIYSAGAYPLNYLQNIVSTLSIDQGVRVALFLDACHSGKLAGQAIGGEQSTAEALARQFGNEVKIMACQPNELSLEGRQWGEGRGLFSFHLIDGLTGLADRNADGSVSLGEMDRYLTDAVPPEAAPLGLAQTPFTVGNRNAALARVDAPSLARLREAKSAVATLSPVGSKGLEDEVLARADSVGRAQYQSFKSALKSGDLLSPDGASADFFFSKLVENQSFKPLAGLMRRNLAAALADDAQQALNAILSDDPFEINTWTSNPAKYRLYPQYLGRAADLIGEGNPLHRPLLAKKLYFEGYNLFQNVGALDERPAVRDSFRAEAKKLFLESLRLDPGAAYSCYSIGTLVEKTGNHVRADSCIFWMKQAIDRAPNWKQPYINIAEVNLNWVSRVDSTAVWVEKARALDSTSYMVLQELSWLRQYQHRPEEANAICRRMMAMRPELPNAYFTLGHTLFMLQGRVDEAMAAERKAMEINNLPNPFPITIELALLKRRRLAEAEAGARARFARPGLNASDRLAQQFILATTLIQSRKLVEAEQVIQKAEETGTDIFWLTRLGAEKGRLLLLLGRPAEAEKALLRALTYNDSDDDAWTRIWALLGTATAAQGRPAEAEAYFKKATSFWCLNTANYFWEEAWYLYGRFLLDQNRDAEARRAFEKTEEIYPNGYYAPYGMALFFAKKGEKRAALGWLEQSLDRFWPIPQPVEEEPLFRKIRKTRRFRELMEKNFPDDFKK